MNKLFKEIASNWKSGLTVALISIPLSLSLAIASGATPLMGIITSVWAGLIAAALGGSQFNVVGPAGALSGILASFALTNDVSALPILAIVSGILIFAIYLLKWDRYLVFIPSSVMHGFTLGVGLTIALGQMNFALGLENTEIHESLILNFIESLTHLGQAQLPTFAVFIAALGLLFLLSRQIPRIPSAVIVALLGIGVGYLAQSHFLPFTIPTLFSKYGTFHATLIQIPSYDASIFNISLFKTAITVAVVAILETLLSAKILDGMTNTRFNQRQEMFGLALANIGSGLTGGLPATGVLARSALNAKSGATSRFSSGINALFVLGIALLLFQAFQYLPLAVVASILVFAAIRMVEAQHFIRLFRFDMSSFWLAMLVAALTYGVDPMVGILVGATIALLEVAQHLSRGRSELTLHRDNKLLARVRNNESSDIQEDSDVIVYRFAGELTYFNGKSHEDALKKIKAGTIVLSLRNLFYIDIDGLDMLKEIIEHLEAVGRKIILTGASEYTKPLFEKTSWFVQRERNGTVFGSTTEALSSLGFPIGM